MTSSTKITSQIHIFVVTYYPEDVGQFIFITDHIHVVNKCQITIINEISYDIQ